jgi:Secretion system C-terminal sorting domain
MIKYTASIILFIFIEILLPQDVYHITEIKKPVFMGLSKPLREMVGQPAFHISGKIDYMVPNNKYLPPHRTISENSIVDPWLQTKEGLRAPGDIIMNMEGINNRNGYYPPDVSGDVGPNHYMMMINCSYQIWNKTGTSLLGPFNLSTIWSELPSPLDTMNSGDPVVLYDGLANRWFASQMALPNYPLGPFYELVAVSTTPDPTGTWYTYAYSFTNMNDYPKFGVWPDGYYMSANLFTPTTFNFVGCALCVIDRNTMLTGGVATMQEFDLTNPLTAPWSILPSHCTGAAPPAGSNNYFVWSHDDAWYGGSDELQVIEFHTDWTTPANSHLVRAISLPITAYTTMSTKIPQPGTSNYLDPLSERLLQRLQYRNFSDHEAMVVCQTIDAGNNQAGIRWYNLHKTTGKWFLYQQGTYAPSDSLHRWMGGISMDATENIALGYSVSSSSVYPSIRFTGRLAADPIGTMTFGEKTIIDGTGYQDPSPSHPDANRWGDYTSMSIDPDGITFWYTDEYVQTSGVKNWQTRIASFQMGTALPVELTSFIAFAYNKSVKLNWRTETEVNNHGFDIERRVKGEYKDENSGWAKVGFIAGNGNSNKPINYSYTDNIINKGTELQYRLKQINKDGVFKYTTSINVTSFPSVYVLSQNYPNPFNPNTVISYSFPSASNVKLIVYNTLGQTVIVLENGFKNAGNYSVNFNAAELPSGIYFYKLEAGEFSQIRKMILLK